MKNIAEDKLKKERNSMEIATEKGTFILLYRKFLEWRWYKYSDTKDLFLHLLLTAEWRNVERGDSVLERGQVLTTESRLATELNQTRQRIRTSMSNLVKTNEITKETTNKGTLITIENYDFYQRVTPKVNQQPNQAYNQGVNQQPNQVPTNRQPTANQSTFIYNKNNKNNKDYNNNARARERHGDGVPINNQDDKFTPVMDSEAREKLDEVRENIRKKHAEAMMELEKGGGAT